MTRIPVFLAAFVSVACVGAAVAHETSAARHHSASHEDDDEDCDEDDDSTEARHRGDRSSFAWAVVREDGNSMSGSLEDLKRALRVRKAIAPPYLWVRDGDDRYVISDEKVLEQLDELEKPQRILAAKQAKLGAKQAELGQKQARLGLQQARAANELVRRATGTDEGDGSRATGADDGDGSRAAVHDISEQQRDLGQVQGQLGREQGALGREQGRLGRRVEQRVRALYEEAKKSGAARRLD